MPLNGVVDCRRQSSGISAGIIVTQRCHKLAQKATRLRLGGAAAAGRRRHFFLVFHRALPDLQRMKHMPDQAFGHREVFCFFLAELLLADSGADDGARAIGADADRLRLVGAAAMVPAPIERREVRGHRQQIGKSAALTVGGAQCRALSPDFPAGARGLYPLARGCRIRPARGMAPALMGGWIEGGAGFFLFSLASACADPRGMKRV